MIPLPANYLHCIEALVSLMRKEGKTYLSVSDGNHVYRIGLMGSSIQIHITETTVPLHSSQTAAPTGAIHHYLSTSP